jgi:hypothetical protein
MKLDMEMFNDNIIIQVASDSETKQKIYIQFTPRTGKHWFVYEKDGKGNLCVGLQNAIAQWNKDCLISSGITIGGTHNDKNT